MLLQKFIFGGEGDRIIFLILANKIWICSDDSACAATECRSPLKTICCAQDLQWRPAGHRMLVKCCCEVHPPLWLKLSRQFLVVVFFPRQKRHSLLSWADCIFVAQAVDELSVLLLLCCGRLRATNVFLPVFVRSNANSYKQKMRGTVRGLCWSCECLEGRASWRRRRPQYSPPFCCKLGPKTPTFQPCQHHRYCQM